jgi:ferrochelatase
VPHTPVDDDSTRLDHTSDLSLVPDLIEETRRSPRTRRARSRAYDAILLASFGGPEQPEDVMPFLRNVTRGRGVPEERLEEVSHHYMALGGRSPLNAQNRVLLEALRGELDARGIDLPVHWGNRNWRPSMREAVERLHAEGHRRVLAIATSAYSSYSSCRQYREDFGAALVETGLIGRMEIHKVRPYFDLPGFLEPLVDGVLEASASLRAAGHREDRQHVLFATHSIPTAMAEASGPEGGRGDGPGGWYVAQHEAACRWVMEEVSRRLAGGAAPAWDLVYQSRSGPPSVPWLEPDINDAISGNGTARSADSVIVVPIGFVSDHVEVIWDLDTEAAETAGEHDLAFRRVPTAGTDPRTVSALVDLVVERLDDSAPRASATSFGGTPDVCGTACCSSGARAARPRPTTSALDSPEDVAAAAAPAAGS